VLRLSFFIHKLERTFPVLPPKTSMNLKCDKVCGGAWYMLKVYVFPPSIQLGTSYHSVLGERDSQVSPGR
jgi:hypothetical protein